MHYIKSQYCDKIKCYTCQKYYPQGLITPSVDTRKFFGPKAPAGECPHGHIIENLYHNHECPCTHNANDTIRQALEEWRTFHPSPEGQYALLNPYETGSFIKEPKTTVEADLEPTTESTVFMDNIEYYFEDYIEQIWNIDPDDENLRIKVICDGHIDDYIIRPLTPDEYFVYAMNKHDFGPIDRRWRYVMEDYHNAFSEPPENYIEQHAFPSYSMKDIVFVKNVIDDFDTRWDVCAIIPLSGIDYDNKPMRMKMYGNGPLGDFEKTIEKEVVDVFNDIALYN